MKYVNVIIDNKSNSTDNTFTYMSEDDCIRAGNKVKVSFAKGKSLRDGYVVSVIEDESVIDDELKKKLKPVEEIDDSISLTEEMINTAVWMKKRYLCRYIDAIKCFTPVGSKNRRKSNAPESRDEETEREIIDNLTEEQARAVAQIKEPIIKGVHDRFLIHGVTGSGKTEIYIRAAEETIKQGRGVIILVPEISLTGQIVERFKAKFGADSTAVLHSRLTVRERHDQWQKIRWGQVRIVIGARSAAFAPVENLGLIVVDEEHESTYKSDFTPKYDTTEVAIKRLQDRNNNGVLILGSATPSVSTYNRALAGIYKLITLNKRYNLVEMPDAEIVDMRLELKKGNRSPVSVRLADEMKNRLEDGEQIILFLNRRGYSTFVSCRECGYVAKCPKCGLSLTYHRGASGNRLACHYCGYEEAAVTKCPECGSGYVRYFGSGTEKIEEAVAELFPEYTVDRVDLDSIKKKGELTRKLKAFEKGRTDILIGTQLIAKGLDFKNVGLAGIISADVSLNIPDFRSAERTFQLITQASGRAGRGEKKGKVIIQTYSPEHYAVTMAAEGNYREFYEIENRFRDYMMYPPYSDIFQIIFTAGSMESAEKGATLWYKRLQELLGGEAEENLFRPQEAYMSKIRETCRYSLILKCPRGRRREYSQLIEILKDEEKASAKKRKQDYIAIVDVNPYSFS